MYLTPDKMSYNIIIMIVSGSGIFAFLRCLGFQDMKSPSSTENCFFSFSE